MSFPADRQSAAPTSSVTCFAVIANAEPSALPRILGLFAAPALVPRRLYTTQDGETLNFDLQIDGLDADAAETLSWQLRTPVCARGVLCTAKPDDIPVHIAV